MVLFFQASYGEVWNKLVAGLEWAKRFRVRWALGMQPTLAVITYARQRLGWQVMARLMEQAAGPLAGQESESAFVSGRGCAWSRWMGCVWMRRTPRRTARSSAIRAGDERRGPFPQIRV